MSEEKENVQIRLCNVAILLVFSTCSSSLLLPILPFGLVACTLVFFLTFLELAVNKFSILSCSTSGVSRGRHVPWDANRAADCFKTTLTNFYIL